MLGKFQQYTTVQVLESKNLAQLLSLGASQALISPAHSSFWRAAMITNRRKEAPNLISILNGVVIRAEFVTLSLSIVDGVEGGLFSHDEFVGWKKKFGVLNGLELTFSRLSK